ncbi:hypothetical protein [Flagellimonas onchidii]|uniref:hypothetical protein n=1 Tax=Flagellimonas onchidii TaxID=2562684 RepID=UPI0010A5D4F8|nr:hypothetical protein [Allomuricauda onchidii]
MKTNANKVGQFSGSYWLNVLKKTSKVLILTAILSGTVGCEKEEDYYCELVRYQYQDGQRIEVSRKDWNASSTASVEYGQGVFHYRDLDGDGELETYRDYIECNGEVTPLEDDIPVVLGAIETDKVELAYGDNACSSTKFVFFIPKGETFETTTKLFSKYDGTVYTLPFDYSNGAVVRRWDGKKFYSTEICK